MHAQIFEVLHHSEPTKTLRFLTSSQAFSCNQDPQARDYGNNHPRAFDHPTRPWPFECQSRRGSDPCAPGDRKKLHGTYRSPVPRQNRSRLYGDSFRCLAQFGYPEIQRGFVPAMVMATLRRAVGETVAFDLVATGRILTAREAERIGLVSRVIGSSKFEEAVERVLRNLSDASSSALTLIKQQLYGLEGLSFEEAIALGAQVNAVARSTPDFKEAVSKFLRA